MSDEREPMNLTYMNVHTPIRGARAAGWSAAATVGAAVAVALLVMTAGCGDSALPGVPKRSQPTRPPASPVPTATSTATSPPLAISDTLREQTARDPEPQPGATCGLVDTLDFPVGPPDGDRYLPRWVFGRFSSRRDKYHAGEDWLRTHGESLGAPVYAVGHGTVTYAEPWGWGGDKGVVIVRHVFGDGTTTLSFYGHLDPPSVLLTPGDCVERGDTVGAIGQPNTRPHLHFEIRDHMPDTPGPGYWDTDPTGAGWHPPSEFIWERRVQSAPGVAWTRQITDPEFALVGLMADGTLVAVEDDEVLGLDPGSGESTWRFSVGPEPGGDDAPAVDAESPGRDDSVGSSGGPATPEPGPASGARALGVSAVEVDTDGRTVYVATRDGRLTAMAPGDGSPDELWRRDLPGLGPVSLAPLPGGGVAAHAQWQMTAFDRDGRVSWRISDIAAPTAWSHSGEHLLLTTEHREPGVHAIDPSGRLLTLFAGEGAPISSTSTDWVYATDGVFAIDPVAGPLATTNLLRLAPWIVPSGDAVALPDGGLLVSHREPRDRRLIALNGDGSLRWSGSVRDLDRSAQLLRVAMVGEQAVAVTGDGDVLAIDPATGSARKVFEAGAGPRMRGDNQALAVGPDRLVLDFRGGQLIALELGAPTGTSSP